MKILLIGPYGIGNTILALPSMKLLRQKHPDAQIDLATLLRSSYEMVRSIPDFDLFDNVFLLSFRRSKIELMRRLLVIRKRKYDYSAVLFPSARMHYNLLSFLAGARKRIGSEYPDINFKRAHFLNNMNIPVICGLHDVYQNINLLSALGIDYKEVRIGELMSIGSNKEKRNVIGVHPGGKRTDYYKRWSREKYVDVINDVIKNTGHGIKIFLGPDEIEDYDFFRSKLKSKPIKFVLNEPIEKLFDEINECRIFLSNDTGLMHIANFLGCYNIVVVGASDSKRTGPFNQPHELIHTELPCQPCSHSYGVKSHRFHCVYGDVRCMNLITPEMVAREIRKTIENYSTPLQPHHFPCYGSN